MANTFFNRTSGTSTNAKKFTLSVWVKRSVVSNDPNLIYYSGTGGTANGEVSIQADDSFQLYERNASSTTWNLKTNRKLRDCSSYYHIHVKADSTQATDSDRVKLWINGDLQNSFTTETYPAQDWDFEINSSSVSRNIGKYVDAATYYFEGYMAQFIFTDGYAYDASTFGQFDTVTGEWSPKGDSAIRSAVTFGNNGYLLPFSDTSNLGYDYQTSDRSTTNDWTKSGDGYGLTDNPSNNFCTMDYNQKSPHCTMDSAGLVCTGNADSAYGNAFSTYVIKKGKWYVECKVMPEHATLPRIGLMDISVTDGTKSAGTCKNTTNYTPWVQSTGATFSIGTNYAYNSVYTNDSGTAFPSTNLQESKSTGAIIRFAIDMDNGAWYIGKDGGTWWSSGGTSGDPTSGASKTGAAFTWTPSDLPRGFALCDTNYYTPVHTWTYWNFGQGRFDGTAVSSANADANGYGVFEDTVPTGYYAICSKNIKEFG